MNKPLARLYAAPDGHARFTAAEFLRMCDSGAFDDMKVELVKGELERMPPPGTRHAARQAQVLIRLSMVIALERLVGEVGIDLGDDTVLGCDAVVLHAPVMENRRLVPADVLLAVEVAETSVPRDTGMKRLAYAEAGIPHYWVLDGDRSVVRVFSEPLAGDYVSVSTVAFGAPVAVPGTDRTIVID